MRPSDLAEELGIDGRRLRGWLRDVYPRAEMERGAGWVLTEEQVAAARAHFAERSTRRSGAVTRKHPSTAQIDGRDWFWEGNVVAGVYQTPTPFGDRSGLREEVGPC